MATNRPHDSALTPMEVCVQGLSVSANVNSAADIQDDPAELPTVINALRKMVNTNRFHSKHRVEHRSILRDVSVHIKPRTMTLVLGRPGSGKSSLLKALGGQLPLEGPNRVEIEGKITYNDVVQSDMPASLPRHVGYVSQNDDHFATLTVKETLQFAYEFAGGSSNGSTDSKTQWTPKQVVEALGLTHCQDTVLGDAVAIRGVSGGERKRVTLGEGMLGCQSVLLLDEISTGLDAAATLDIISLLKTTFVLEQGRAVVVSLLQPDAEVFVLFDNVVVLNDGEMLYSGLREAVSDYFSGLGLCCPQGHPVADFLLDIGTSHQSRYETRVESLSTVVPKATMLPQQPREFADSFQQSTVYRQMLEPNAVDSLEPVKSLEWMLAAPAFPQPFWRNTISLTRRQLMLASRNTAFLRARAVMAIAMGLIYGSIFYQVKPTDMQLVLGLCFQAVFFMLLGQTAQIASFVDARVILAKQRRAQLTRSASYVLACCAGQLPAAVAETVVFGSLTYWLGGLDFDNSSSSLAARYLVFEGLLFLTLLAAIAWFFIVAAVSSDRNVAFPVAMASIIAVILFGGFVVAKDQLPDWLIWGYWLDPLAWSLRAIAVSAYRSPSMDKCVYDGVDFCQLSDGEKTAGEYYLSSFAVPSEQMWVPLAAGFLLFSYAVFMALAWVLLDRMCRQHTEDSTIQFTAKPKSTINCPPEEGYALAVTPRTEQNASCAVDIEHPMAPTVIPVTLGFEDLWYSVPDPSADHANGNTDKRQIDLLKGISGYAQPGTMTALMGSSGAGKTTLLDVLAGRKSAGSVRGRILLNGQAAPELAVRRCTGYCEQVDLHSDGSTIREALLFSAFLRQENSVPDHDKRAVVEECLDLLELRDIDDQLIRGRTREQLKRVSIGVELAARNSVLFLDEPTSGLDAQAAAIVMRTVRRAADRSQCTVVCTIHQPSANVFSHFDKLLLLQLGGEVVYFGDSEVNTLKAYFEKLPGTTPLPDGCNPAAWILECVGAGVMRTATQALNYAQLFKASKNHQVLQATMGYQQQHRDEMVPLKFSAKRASSSWTQMRFLLARFRALYWRTPSYSLSRLFLAVGLGLILGLLFSGSDFATYQGANAGVGGIFMSISFTTTVAINSVLPLAVDDRAVFYRERSAQSYNALWYFVGVTLAEIPYVVVSSFLFTLLSFTIMGFTDGGDASWGVATFALYWLAMALLTLQQVYFGQFLAYALPELELASLTGTVLSSLLFLVAGFNPPSSSIPQGYRWLQTIAPQRYTLAAMTALVFADCSPHGDSTDHFGCQTLQDAPLELQGVTVKQYIESVFEMKHDDIARNIAVSFAYVVVFQLLGLLALRFVSHQRK